MHDAETIRRHLEGCMTRNHTEPTPLGGNNLRLRGIRRALAKDVATNGVRKRGSGASTSPGLTPAQVQAIRNMR